MTRVKMCGMTRVDDIRAAAELGVDAVGLIFWPGSPRSVTRSQAARLVEAAPPFVMVIGVFVNCGRDEVTRTVRDVGLGGVQLHGDELVAEWADMPVPVFKAVGVDDHFQPAVLHGWPDRIVPLLDVCDPARRGGTGQPVNWTLAALAARVRPLILAGGLTAETVGEAIRLVAPAAVDVSSGIEARPGVKSVDRMAAFMRAVRSSDGAATGSDDRDRQAESRTETSESRRRTFDYDD